MNKEELEYKKYVEEQERLRDEELSLEADTFYSNRVDKMNYFEDKY